MLAAIEKIMTGPRKNRDDIVLCPACNLLLQVPPNSQCFRCTCGITLSTKLNTQSQTAPTQATLPRSVSHCHISKVKRPPVYTNDTSRPDCEICSTPFTLLWRRHHCRNCGALVCRTCSNKRWPKGMLPSSYNLKKEKLLRVCDLCHKTAEEFRSACLDGDLNKAQTLYATGTVHLDHPYIIFPYSLYPIHCAASSGSIQLVSWLLSKGCSAHVTDGRGWTGLTCAAAKPEVELVRYLIRENISSIEEISEKYILQKCLVGALASLDRNVSFGEVCNVEPPPAYNLSRIPSPDCAPVPSSAQEEAEQVNIALAASIRESQAFAFEVQMNESNSIIPANGSKQQQLTRTVSSSGRSSDAGGPSCIVCFESPVATVFVPCGHSCCCIDCSKEFEKECPVCRGAVDQIIRTFSISS
mmetsp:Transcript_3941/g.4545  ORF Transcript_3941/g.4545 Transcript_3941/m.4545 type:complete len:413 (-) Transcript_3941:352-1590(-)